MSKRKEPVNPYYVLLVLLGVVFLVTTCAYGTMAWRATRPVVGRDASGYELRLARAEGEGVPPETISDNHSLMTLMDEHGVELLGGELGLLALATFGAMWLDQLRARRQAATEQAEAAASVGGGQIIG